MLDSGILVDQRGALRPVDGDGDGVTAADIGAVEFGFLVNTTDDTVDANPGDGRALDANGNVSLRAAIMEANATAGNDVIIVPAGIYRLSISGADEDAAADGDLDLTDTVGTLTIIGAGSDATIIDGGDSTRVFQVQSNVTVNMSQLAIVNGWASYGGGVLAYGDLTLDGVRVADNAVAQHAGGILQADGHLKILRSTIEGNRNGNGPGGGVYKADWATVDVVDSVFKANVAGGGSRGGGIYTRGYTETTISGSLFLENIASEYGGAIDSAGDMTITNTTISGNRSSNLNGGGIHHRSGTLTITHTTITGNRAGTGRSGGGIRVESGTLQIGNSIVAGNLASLYPDVVGEFTSLGNNLIGDTSGAIGFTDGVNGDIVGGAGNPTVNAQLDVLADNGGPTWTHALLPDSPAIDAGVVDPAVVTDQRGAPRALDGDGDGSAVPDIGAVEYLPTDWMFVDFFGDTPDADLGDGVAGDANGNVSLRAAIMQANANLGADMIVLAAGPYTLTIAGIGEEAAATGDLDITGDLTILGAGAEVTAVDGNRLDRVFQVSAGVNVNISGLTVLGAKVVDATMTNSGGGVLNAGDLTISNAVLRDNWVTTRAQGIGGGGAAYNTSTGTLVLDNVTISENWATNADGGGILSLGQLTVRDCRIINNTAGDDAGAILSGTGSVTGISDTRITGNVASRWAGAVYNDGDLSLMRTSISGNTVAMAAGGIWNDGSLTLTDSTLFDNTATSNDGGGLVNLGTAFIQSSTISGNTSGDQGGGVLNSKSGAAGALTIVNSTVFGNEAVHDAGGIWSDGASVRLENTIVAANAGGNGLPDVFGSFISLGHNLIGNAGVAIGLSHGVNGDLVGTNDSPLDPRLDPLQDNGGPTWTHALLPDSPAIDRGMVDSGMVTDQRGAPRAMDGDGDGTATPDIGAFEYFDPSWFFVDSFEDTVDVNPGDGVVADADGNRTLRAAIMEANALAGEQTIVLAAGTYELSIAGAGEDQAATGDLDVTGNLRLIGAGSESSVIDANRLDRVFQVHAGITVDFESLQITGGDTDGSGGGIESSDSHLNLRRVTIRDNQAASEGGGIRTVGSVTTTVIDDSTLSGNSAANGGGVLSYTHLFVSGATISGNTATTDGGGLWNGGPVEITNSTISGNAAGADGGGLRDTAQATLTNTTVTNNTAARGGGIISGPNCCPTTQLQNTIVAGNSATDGPDVSRTFVSLGSNLVGDVAAAGGFTDGVNGDIVGGGANPAVDPKLGPLQDNGGPTWTHALLPGSPAIDKGDNTDAPATDQRGLARPQDADGDGTATIDIGAYEVYYGQIRGRSFHDRNRDGVQATDGSEPGLAGWTVYLDLNQDGNWNAGEPSTVTGGDGEYVLNGVAPGAYVVAEVGQSDWLPGATRQRTLHAGEVVSALDFGNYFVNTAPVLADTALDILLPLTGTASLDRGTLVRNLTDGVTDADVAAATGIAITAWDNTNGTLQFSLNDGGTWTDAGAVDNANALLLADDGQTRIRYRTSGGYPGTPINGLVTFRAWDQTEGNGGNKVDTTVNGLNTAFSTTTDTVDATFTGVFWDGGAGDGLWSSAANWNGDTLPTATDDVLVDVVGTASVIHDGGATTLARFVSEESLQVDSGSLTVTDVGVVSASLTLNAGSMLSADGPNAVLLATGATTANGASLYALNGGTVDLPSLATYFHSGPGGSTRVFRADGAGSRLILPQLRSLDGPPQADSYLDVQALNGGQIDLTSLTDITTDSANHPDAPRGVRLPVLKRGRRDVQVASRLRR